VKRKKPADRRIGGGLETEGTKNEETETEEEG
jgi:hypothetical protein